jgi:hypothetical protein
MTGKRGVIRPFAPDYCARDLLACRLDCLPDKVDTDVKSRLLRPPELVDTMQRWRWDEVVAFMKARNGKLDGATVDEAGNGSSDIDPFSFGGDACQDCEILGWRYPSRFVTAESSALRREQGPGMHNDR